MANRDGCMLTYGGCGRCDAVLLDSDGREPLGLVRLGRVGMSLGSEDGFYRDASWGGP